MRQRHIKSLKTWNKKFLVVTSSYKIRILTNMTHKPLQICVGVHAVNSGFFAGSHRIIQRANYNYRSR